MEKTVEDIGIYTDIYRTNESDGRGNRLYHTKCKICGQELFYPIESIRENHKQCRHVQYDISQGIGIYTDIHESGNKNKSGHKLYYATCSVCNTIVEKTLSDLKESNRLCRHKAIKSKDANYKINDMPVGWMNESKLNMRTYYLWKAMIMRTTEKYWQKHPTYTGTTVDDRWRVLSNFVNDIKDLEGYDKWVIASSRQMMLDKDTIIEGNKHYSKDTCCFITHTESNQDVSRRHPENIQKAQQAFIENASNPVRFTNIKTNEVIDFPSLKEGCRTLKLNLRNAWAVLSERYPNNHTTKDWTITKIQI